MKRRKTAWPPSPAAAPKLREWKLDSGSWYFRTESLIVCVHQHRDESPDMWFATCHDIRMERVPLRADTVEAAQAEGLQKVRERLRDLLVEVPS